jgi:hypothetical protein
MDRNFEGKPKIDNDMATRNAIFGLLKENQVGQEKAEQILA